MRSGLPTPWRWLVLATAVASGVADAAKLTLPSERPIVVRADFAANDPDNNVTRFQGHFSIEGTDWPTQADTAIVYGPLEDPERVVISGNPAHLWVNRSGIDRQVEAQAREIEYTRNLEVLRLRGDARVIEGGRRSLESEYFEYDLKTEKVRHGRPVRIRILPAKSEDESNLPQDNGN